jgi:outer membrane protein assembly factor BamB
VGLRGTAAFDAGRNRIYVPRNCAASSADCKVLAVDAPSGAVVWEQPMTSMIVAAPCHAAVASSGTIYTACGSSARFFHPDKPAQFTAGFNTSLDSVALAPALASDGSVYLIFDGNNPTMMVTNPQLKILWPHGLSGKPLAPPLLDRDDNVYLCTQKGVTSLDKSGALRWSHTFPNIAVAPSSCAMVLSGSGQLDVVTSNRVYRFN